MTMLYLASQSPRRRRLITLLGLPVTLVDVAVDESSVTLPDPADNVVATAVLKGEAAYHKMGETLQPGDIIVGADTTVALDGEMLGKPADADTARLMLRRLRGRRHHVHTGLALVGADGRRLTDIASIEVPMRAYSDREIEAYVATGDPLDKAGAYAIQHSEFRPVTMLGDCYAAVVGLPLCHLTRTLRRFGVNPPADVPAACQRELAYDCPVWPAIL